jgi:N-acetylglutamate synthase-like GNAT family acetyltransferase
MGLGQARIRRARRGDVDRIALLSGQLGYPTSRKAMVKRLNSVLASNEGACFVAETGEQGVIGWIHVSVTPLLEVERCAEVNGLVVDEHARSAGTGWLLLDVAEKWAKKMRCTGMSVRSNVLRERAHGFYLRHGYQHFKTQKAFRKAL